MFKLLEKFSKLKIEYIYLLIALAFGLLMAIFNPPFAGVPDEHAHYWKASIVSEGGFWCNKKNTIKYGSYELPDSVKPVKVRGFNDKKISLTKIKEALLLRNDSKKIAIKGVVCNTMSVGYFPQALGIKIGDILNMSPLAGFYLARILNLFLAIYFFYLAIKIIPFGKMIILLIGFLPSTIQQMASMSYDALHISLSVLFFAYVLRIAIDKKFKLSNKKIFLLVGLSAIGLNIKLGYFPLVFLVFLIPWKKFGNKKRYYLTTFLITLTTIAVFLGIALLSGDSVGYKDGVNPITQLKYVLTNPFNFLFVVFETIYNNFFFLMETFILKPGWLSHSLPDWLYVFVLVFAVIFIKNEDEAVNISLKQRFIIGACFIFTFLTIFLSLYLGWTNVGSGQISGVQGRYFLAVAPLLIFFFYKLDFSLKLKVIRENKNILFVIFSLIVFIATFFSVYSLYYKKTGTDNKYLYEGFTTKKERSDANEIEISESFQQKFIASRNKIIGIKIFMNKTTLTKPVTFYLKDKNCQKTIFQKTMNKKRYNIKSLKIKFGLIFNSKNKKYCLTSSDLSQILTVKVFNKKNAFSELSYDKNNKTGQSMIYDIIYKN